MNGPVLGAIITASVALAVAIGGAVRSTVQTALERRYERRRAVLMQAQDAMLVLREELAAYGVALHEQVTGDAPALTGVPAVGIDAAVSGAAGVEPIPPASSSFVMAVPAAANLRAAPPGGGGRGRVSTSRTRRSTPRSGAGSRWPRPTSSTPRTRRPRPRRPRSTR